jgi:hypothetical protein
VDVLVVLDVVAERAANRAENAENLAENAANRPAHAGSWPEGYFEKYFGALGDESVVRHPQGALEERDLVN